MSFYPFNPSAAPSSALYYAPSGLTGATAASRYVGATTGGPPGSGTFAAGDFVIDQSGAVWVCVTAGSPGTWVDISLNDGVSWVPADAGFLAWSYDPMLASTGSAPANNTVTVIRINIRAPISCTNVSVFVSATGSGLVTGENFVGLYNSAGTLIGTSADQTTAWGSTGLKTAALAGGPFPLAAGTFVWAAILPNESAGTVPSFMRPATLVSNAAAGIGVTAATARWATTSSTGTSLPPSITPSGNTNISTAFWAALS